MMKDQEMCQISQENFLLYHVSFYLHVGYHICVNLPLLG